MGEEEFKTLSSVFKPQTGVKPESDHTVKEITEMTMEQQSLMGTLSLCCFSVEVGTH